MEIIYVGAAAFIGGLVDGALGWLGKGTPFSGRKFVPNILRALTAGGGIALAYPFLESMGLWPAILAAFLAGAGVDVLGHRIAGTMKSS